MRLWRFVQRAWLRRRWRALYLKAFGRLPPRARRQDAAFAAYVELAVRSGPDDLAYLIALVEQVGAAVERGVSDSTIKAARTLILPRLVASLKAEETNLARAVASMTHLGNIN